MPTIAVVVPNWNDARYLPRCLGSLLAQDVRPDEVIVVDDQSTDDSVQVASSYMVGQAGWRLVRNAVNQGVSRTLAEGLRVATSEYVLFLASNDFVLPGIFARAKHCLGRQPSGLWSAMAWMVDEEDRLIRLHSSPVVSLRDASLSPEECRRLAYRHGSWFTGITLVFRRDALNAAGGFDPDYGGLTDLVSALVVASIHGASYSPVPFAAIRIHEGSHLADTLRDEAVTEAVLARLRVRGPKRAPDLFTPAFLERTARRFGFASVRARGGDNLATVPGLPSGAARGALRIADWLLPRSWRLMRVATAFLILRPFDVLPSLWNRAFGWFFVRSRHRWPGPPVP